MVKYVESDGEWMELMEQSKEKLVVVDFTASWWVVVGENPIEAAAVMRYEFMNDFCFTIMTFYLDQMDFDLIIFTSTMS